MLGPQADAPPGPLRVLHVKADMDPRSGGSVSAVHAICEVTRLAGDQCDIACVGYQAPDAGDAALRTFAPTWPRRLGTSMPLVTWLLRNVRRYDLVEIHEIFTATAWLAAIVCRTARVPYVVRPHGSLDPFDLRKHHRLKSALGPLLRLLFLRGAAAFCLTTTEERDRLVVFGADSVPRFAIPLPVDPPQKPGMRSDFRARIGAGDSQFVVLFLSRIDYKKGIPRILEALAALRAEGLDVCFAVCGTGTPAFERQIKDAVDRLGLGSVTHFLGFLDGQDKLDAFAGADAFVLPSDNENFGIAVVEAMYARVALVISPNVYISSLLDEARAALVVDATSETVGSAIRQLMSDPAAAEAMSERAAHTAAAHFAPPVVATQEATMRQAVIAAATGDEESVRSVRWHPPQGIKRPVRRVLSPLGFELVRLRRPETQLLTTLLQRERISVVLDVGANQGQYALRLRSLGYTGVIHSFEPGHAAFASLQRFSSADANWHVHQLALSDEAGAQSLFVSEDSVSSSLLPVADAHLRAAPASKALHTESIQTARLDDALEVGSGDRIWLKLDTQGSEDRVLRGASATLLHTRVVQTELSLLPCYDGQADYRQVVDLLHTSGFRLAAVEPGTQDALSGEMLQFDGIFVREPSPTDLPLIN